MYIKSLNILRPVEIDPEMFESRIEVVIEGTVFTACVADRAFPYAKANRDLFAKYHTRELKRRIMAEIEAKLFKL